MQKQENNIKNTIKIQVSEERKRLKAENDVFKQRLQEDYNKRFEDMRIHTLINWSISIKSRVDSNEQKYKSRISTLEKAMVEKLVNYPLLFLKPRLI